MKFYYSIHGSDAEEWRLNLYQYVKKKEFKGEVETITTYWPEPKIFATLEDLCDELGILRGMENE